MDVYVRKDTGQVVATEERHSILKLTRILYRLNIVNTDNVMSIALSFEPIFI